MPGGGSRITTHGTVDRKMHYVPRKDSRSSNMPCVRWARSAGVYWSVTASRAKEPGPVQFAHQANLRIISAAADKLGLDENRVVKNIHKFGNTTAATIPLAVGDALDDGRLKKGSLVLFAAVGAGYTVGSVLTRWAY
jgi:3-oxoacyl-[acyl-carrier-protein] synthase-3